MLTSILDAILFLAKNKLPFIGSSKDINSPNCGNFLALIKYTAKYNPTLALHIARLEKGSPSYLSPRIQNEFITTAGESVRKSIYQDVKKRKYFAIMFDATPDISKKEQVSQIIRTVHSDAIDTYIEESFIDFVHCEGKTGLEISNMIIQKLKEDGLQIENCRAQVYDNASSMSGIYKGVQTRIKEVNPLAEYVPCVPHSLNLVGQNAMQKTLVAVLLLGQVQNIYTFFSASTSRWNLLKTFVKRTPKNQNATRWSSKSDAVHILLEEFGGVINCLQFMMDSENTNMQTIADAHIRFNDIYNHRFILGLIIWDKILYRINICSKAVQSISCNVDSATKHLQSLLDWIKQFQIDGWEKSVKKASSKCEEMGIELESGFNYRATRNSVPARFRDPDEINSVPLSNVEKFKVEFFDKIMYSLVEEFEQRFSALRQVCSHFQFLWGKTLDEAKEEDLADLVKILAAKYPQD